MSEERKKPGMVFWATVVLVAVLVAYPLGYGPVMWLCVRGYLSDPVYHYYRRPLGFIVSVSPRQVRRAFRDYECRIEISARHFGN
jgi:hypothetical protein